jgi:hypothetical protein
MRLEEIRDEFDKVKSALSCSSFTRLPVTTRNIRVYSGHQKT